MFFCLRIRVLTSRLNKLCIVLYFCCCCLFVVLVLVDFFLFVIVLDLLFLFCFVSLFVLFCFGMVFPDTVFLWVDLAVLQTRLALNSKRYACLCLPSTWMKGACHHTRLILVLFVCLFVCLFLNCTLCCFKTNSVCQSTEVRSRLPGGMASVPLPVANREEWTGRRAGMPGGWHPEWRPQQGL